MKELTRPEDWAEVLEKSKKKPVFVLKHSTACPISADAYDEVAGHWKKKGEELPPLYMVKVIESRSISNAIAAELKVTHQSPQMILVEDKKAVWNASHRDITGKAVDKAMEKLDEETE